MQIDWTSFALEILNFLVLVWILKRFLYRPVLEALDARAERMKKQAEDAQAAIDAAEQLKQKYETRLAQWNAEREEKRKALTSELIAERKMRFEELQKSLKEERDRAAARAEAASASQEWAMLCKAQTQAYANSTAMLTRLADSTLTARIAQMVEEDLGSLADERRDALHRTAQALEKDETVVVTSAHELDTAAQKTLAQAIENASGHKGIVCTFNLSPELIAGVRIALGELVLHANLADELAYFQREATHG